ncbi:FUSC family protein [Microbacterium betulae]|uniref:FUSC family protein n=1 Tax=Microbacterium betulae TaxID=2981139 RepID=A0AA97FL70_9MICO|nr:FUSC family protein [Microbacterium sp. AB]WOF24320.1 FUSC family protein [Microbacterium sp. AB]
MRLTAAIRATQRTPLMQVLKSAIATSAAWLLAGAVVPDGPAPVFAAIAALLVVQPSLNQSLSKAVERSVGVVAGVVVASLVGIVLGDAAWVVLVAIAAALILAWALRMTPGTANQVGISALLVIALGPSSPDYALDRVIETVIGAVIGVIVNVVLVPPVALAPARRAVDALGEELAATLERLADALSAPRARTELEELLLTARLLRPMHDAAVAAIEVASESLTLNPRGKGYRDELARLSGLVDRFGPIVTQVVGMTRAFYDHYDDEVSAEPAVQGISEQLRRAAHDVRRLLRRALAEPAAPPTESVPALTAPLSVAAPSGGRWILVGSLLEDLRRIHEALREEG